MVECIIDGIYTNKPKEYIYTIIACKIPIVLLEDINVDD